MIRKIKDSLAPALILFIFVAGSYACSGGDKMMCERDRTYKNSSGTKNRTNYGTRYGVKAKPAKKDYVIKNKKTGKRY